MKHLAIILLIVVFGWTSSVTAQDKKSVTIVATEWSPYTSEALEHGGFLMEIARKSFEQQGYDVTVQFLPWKRALRGTLAGRYDVLVGASYTDERAADLYYPEWHFINKKLLFTTQDKTTSYTELADLCPARIGVLNGSLYTETFSAVECFEVESVDSTESFVRLLLAGRIDLFYQSELSGSALISESPLPDAKAIVKVQPSLGEDNVYIAISKNSDNADVFKADFDAGISALRDLGEIDAIFKRYNIVN